MKAKKVLFLIPVVVLLTLIGGIGIGLANNSVSANKVVETKNCIVPPNTQTTIEYVDRSGSNHQVVVTNFEETGGMNWGVFLQAYGKKYQEKTTMKPESTFENPVEFDGLTVRLQYGHIFFIPYPEDGKCQVEPIL